MNQPPAVTPKQIVLIDLSSVVHPLWHTSSSDPDPNATLTKSLDRIHALASGQPHVAICCDSGRSFRADISPEYKANRPKTDAALRHQLMLCQERLAADGFPVWAVPGFEADDLIATAADELAVTHKHDVLIVSSDKDLLQLVADGEAMAPACGTVKVKSLQSGDTYDAAAVVTKFGVRPQQLLDYLCLVGDAADNVKGAERIGPKTAAALLQQFTGMEGIYECLDRMNKLDGVVTPEEAALMKLAVVKSLTEFRERLPVVRQLIELQYYVTGIPVEDVLEERRSPMEEETENPIVSVENTTPKEWAPGAGVSYVPSTMTNEEAKTAPRWKPTHVSDAAAAAVNEFRSMLPPLTVPPPAEPVSVMSRELAPVPVEWERQLEPRSIAEARELAHWMFQSRLFSNYGNAQAVMSTILAGRELGLQAMASLRSVHIVEGRPSFSADLLRALVIRSGKAKYFRCTERTNDRATFETQRGDDPPMTLTFTMEDAARTGQVKKGSGWEKYPASMLTARASAMLARLVYPDIVAGMYDPSELES